MSHLTTMKLGLLALALSACSRPVPPAPAVAQAPLTPSAMPAAPVAAAPSPTVLAAASSSARPRSEGPPWRATALSVERLVIARGIVDREPQGTDTLFASDEKRLFAFVEVDNPEHAAGELKVQFVGPSGSEQAAVDLPVGETPRWRTWAFTRRAHAPGTWKALVRDASGRVLASTEFEIRG